MFSNFVTMSVLLHPNKHWVYILLCISLTDENWFYFHWFLAKLSTFQSFISHMNFLISIIHSLSKYLLSIYWVVGMF